MEAESDGEDRVWSESVSPVALGRAVRTGGTSKYWKNNVVNCANPPRKCKGKVSYFLIRNDYQLSSIFKSYVTGRSVQVQVNRFDEHYLFL